MDGILRELRRRRAMSLEDVADAVGVSVSQVSRFESGTREPRQSELSALARLYGVPVSRLFGADSTGFTDVPLISWVSAGQLGEMPGVSDLDDFPTIQIAGLPSGHWIALKVEGDSMDRISPPESVILVNLKERRLVANACYIFQDEDGRATYKRWRPDPARMEPVSTNPAHEPVFLDSEPVVIGRVRRTLLDM
jgi:transcriptional regulator with XRE-family HTH domain